MVVSYDYPVETFEAPCPRCGVVCEWRATPVVTKMFMRIDYTFGQCGCEETR